MKIFSPDTINFTNTGLYPRNALFPSLDLTPQAVDPNGTIANGDKVINPISCIEHRELGEWYISIEVSDEYVDYIAQDVICVVKTKEKGEQAFRVKNIEIGQSIICEAWHIGFDTKLLAVDLTAVLNNNCKDAMDTLLLNTVPQNSPYTTYSDIATLSTHSADNMSVYDALVSIADHYNGVLDFDMWQIRITSSLGADRGVTFAYGKNIQQSEIYENWDNVVTKLKPIGNDGIVLNPMWLTADVQYDKPYAKIIAFDTDSVDDLAFVSQMYLDQYKYPKVNYKVKTAIDENVALGDTVHVDAKQFEIDATVLSYDFNVNSQRMKEVEFGNYRRTVKGAFDSIKTEAKEVTLQAVDARGYMRTLIDDEVVTVGPGGHYDNINDALFYLAFKYPRFKQQAYPYTVSSAEILLLSGFVMNEQVIVQRTNLGFITISSEDAEVTINRSSLTTPLNTFEFPNEYPAFGGDENAVLPVINVLFNMNKTGLSDRRHGIFVSKNSSAHIRNGKGFKNCGGYGIYAEGLSQVNAEQGIFTDCEQNGISANNCSRINCQNANVSGSGWTGVIATDSSFINAESVNASNCNIGVVAQRASVVNAEGVLASGSTSWGFRCSLGAQMNVNGSIGIYANVLNTLTSDGIMYKT